LQLPVLHSAPWVNPIGSPVDDVDPQRFTHEEVFLKKTERSGVQTMGAGMPIMNFYPLG